MDYLNINSEIRENNRVLQNLKDAMKQRNLARMIDAKKKLNERYGFYDTLSNKVSLVPFKRAARVDEYNRLTGEYNVLNARYLQLKATLEAEKRRNDQRFSLLQLPGEDLPTYYLRLTTPTHRGGVGFKNLDRALLAVAAAKLESNKHAPPPNPNKWKCSACHHMNPKTDKKCTMCEEPKPNKFQMLKKSKRKSSRKSSKRKASRKTSRKRRSAKRKTSRKRRSAKRKTSRKRKSSKRKASRKRSRKRRSSKRCPAGCVKKKTSKRKSRKVKKS